MSDSIWLTKTEAKAWFLLLKHFSGRVFTREEAHEVFKELKK